MFDFCGDLSSAPNYVLARLKTNASSCCLARPVVFRSCIYANSHDLRPMCGVTRDLVSAYRYLLYNPSALLRVKRVDNSEFCYRFCVDHAAGYFMRKVYRILRR